MVGCPILWEAKRPNVERSNASLEEVTNLPDLTALEVDIKDENVLPKDFFSKKLERYHISVGDWSHGFVGQYYDGDGSIIDREQHLDSFLFIQLKCSRTIKMTLNSSFCLEELQGIKSVEFLCLHELPNVKNGLQELDNDCFSQLKHLHVQYNL
ncbi:hypothetical protein Patl1_22800 [Pistacia atlantica]|uniref:Uncharacterized protein n=1 Tax=Pistacia atlantica TaxID=434234 RepID=A0ACC0ZWV7_9ROSI|nr:hypothetical protein Patl1_22800 [Pistacia atlantica]